MPPFNLFKIKSSICVLMQAFCDLHNITVDINHIILHVYKVSVGMYMYKPIIILIEVRGGGTSQEVSSLTVWQDREERGSMIRESMTLVASTQLTAMYVLHCMNVAEFHTCAIWTQKLTNSVKQTTLQKKKINKFVNVTNLLVVWHKKETLLHHQVHLPSSTFCVSKLHNYFVIMTKPILSLYILLIQHKILSIIIS